MIENRICEGTDSLKAALGSGVTSLQVVVVSARSVSRGSDEAVSLLYVVPWPSCPTVRNDRLTHHSHQSLCEFRGTLIITNTIKPTWIHVKVNLRP